MVLPVAVAAEDAVRLPEFGVNSPRISNQVPVGTFAMPVSALRYDPRVDLHGRNLAEAQADVTVRGGIFENTGFQVGAVTLGDPQTGHYFAEIPIAPAMLTAPVLTTGADLALGAANATAGAIAQHWRPIRSGGSISAALGTDGLVRGEVHAGAALADAFGGRGLWADVAVAHSSSDGSLPYGESRFDRANVRLQARDARSQTDLFAGYQAKFFGWPNLYTPFNSNETENLQTVLIALNHRATFGSGEFVEAGAFHRRHRDDYAFNRFAPVGPVHPFQHTTWLTGAALSARRSWGEWFVNARAEAAADRLRSTALTFGRFNTRTTGRLAIVPERTWRAADGGANRLRLGATYDDSNRDRAALLPVAEWTRDFAGGALRQVRLGFAGSSQIPTYTALNSNGAAGLFRGNANLGRQISRNGELAAVVAAGGWTGEAALFARRDTALVDWTFRRGVTARTANAVDLETAGAEVVARREWSRGEVVLGYTALTKDPDYRGAAADASFYALNYARHRLTAAVTLRLTPEFMLRLDNVLQRQAANLLRTVGGDRAFLTGAGLAYRPAAWRGTEFSVQAENLWNETFQAVPAVPAAKRQVAVGVTRVW